MAVKSRIAGTVLCAAPVIAGLAFNPADAAVPFNDPADVKAITAIEIDLATQTHMKDLIGYYMPNALVLDLMTPGIYRGHKQIAEAFDRQLASVKSMKFDVLDKNIASDGKLACAALRLKIYMVMKDGSKLDVSTRQLDAYKKIDGKWKLVEQHISFPVDPKTGMAVLNGSAPVRGPIEWSSDPIPGPATSVAKAKAEIRKWMEVGALSTSIEQLLPYYGPGDDTLVFDDFYPGELRGMKEIRDNYTPVMGSYDSIKVKMPIFVDDSDGVFGIQADTQDMKLHMKDGSTQYISLRQSDCLRRVDGKWKSFFEMISFPVDMKTGKAIMKNPAAFK